MRFCIILLVGFSLVASYFAFKLATIRGVTDVHIPEKDACLLSIHMHVIDYVWCDKLIGRVYYQINPMYVCLTCATRRIALQCFRFNAVGEYETYRADEALQGLDGSFRLPPNDMNCELVVHAFDTVTSSECLLDVYKVSCECIEIDEGDEGDEDEVLITEAYNAGSVPRITVYTE